MDSRIDVIIDIRGFNRFYTNMLGLLNANIGSSDYSLTETRIIYEISKTEKCSANQLSNILRIDTGYLSRILKKLEKEGVLERHSSEDDARINEISLTEKGHELFEQMNNDSNVQIASLIESLTDEECHEISKACDSIKKYLSCAVSLSKCVTAIHPDFMPLHSRIIIQSLLSSKLLTRSCTPSIT